MDSKSESLICSLASRKRVLLLGGMAMLAHGMVRYTKDIDIWLDPGESAEEWAEILLEGLRGSPTAKIVNLKNEPIAKDGLPRAALDGDVVRITGLDMIIDVFHRPNNVSVDDFDEIWERSIPQKDGLRVPDEIDLGMTKLGTGRLQDKLDIDWLDAKILPVLTEKLKDCSLDEAAAIFARIVTPELCAAAADNPNATVRSLALMTRRQL